MHNLTYRNLNEGDFGVIHAMASHWETVRQLGSWPWPSDPAHSMSRCKPYTGEGFVWAICLDDVMCGTIGVTGSEVGYCLDAAYAGRGITTQAVRHAVNTAFTTRDIDRIVAHVWFDNIASLRVLNKIGFTHWFTAYEHSFVRKMPTLSQSHRLLRSDWTA